MVKIGFFGETLSSAKRGGWSVSEWRQKVQKNWQSNWDPSDFRGSSADYVRAYAIISTIADKRTVSGLREVYNFASKNIYPLCKRLKLTLVGIKRKFQKLFYLFLGYSLKPLWCKQNWSYTLQSGI